MVYLDVRHIIQDDFTHSIPMHDFKQHICDRNCTCKPFLIDVQGQHIVIHKPFDRRDLLSNHKYNMFLNPKLFWNYYGKN